MGNTTVNGKAYDVCLAELAAPAAKHEYVSGANKNFRSIDIDAYRRRIYSVLGGPKNVSVLFPEYQQFEHGSRFEAVAQCVIRVKSDDGQILSEVSAWGGFMKTPTKNSEEFVDLGNVTKTAQADAFKEACKLLNLFGWMVSSDAEAEPEKSPAPTTLSPSTERAGGILLRSNSPLEFFEKGTKNEGEPAYRISDAVMEDGTHVSVIFWHMFHSKDASKFEAFRAMVAQKALIHDEYLFRIRGEVIDYNGRKQVKFLSFCQQGA